MSVVLCDLRSRFGSARDQDQRPTCLAFAASDAHAALRSPWAPLSAEYAFYHAQRRAARTPHVGATLPAMLDAVREDGQPVEAGWPYLVTVPTDWKPAASPRLLSLASNLFTSMLPTGLDQFLHSTRMISCMNGMPAWSFSFQRATSISSV